MTERGKTNPFEKNSWYFRNALVRANYTNMNKGIYMNTDFLEKFFRNLMFGEHNELKNRYCHIRYAEKVAISSEKKFGENIRKNSFTIKRKSKAFCKKDIRIARNYKSCCRKADFIS